MDTEAHIEEMPLEGEELFGLSDEALAIWDEVQSAMKPDSDGGKKITGQEGLVVAQKVSAFLSALLGEIAD